MFTRELIVSFQLTWKNYSTFEHYYLKFYYKRVPEYVRLWTVKAYVFVCPVRVKTDRMMEINVLTLFFFTVFQIVSV